MKKKLINANAYPACCSSCEHGRLSPDGQCVLCVHKGIVKPDGKCRKYSYDPLRREPQAPPPELAKAQASDFEF